MAVGFGTLRSCPDLKLESHSRDVLTVGRQNRQLPERIRGRQCLQDG